VTGLRMLDRKLVRDLWHLRGQLTAVAVMVATLDVLGSPLLSALAAGPKHTAIRTEETIVCSFARRRFMGILLSK